MKELDQYFKAVNKQLSVSSGKRRRAAMEELRGDVQSYLSEHPNAGIHDVMDCFGSPEEIAASFLEGEKPEAFQKQRQVKKTALIIICIAIFLLAVSLIAMKVYFLIDNYMINHGYIEISVAREGTPPPPESDVIHRY